MRMLTLRTFALAVCVGCLWPGVRPEDQYPPPAPGEGSPPDLQVGCEEGYSTEATGAKDPEEKARRARSYFYTIRTPSSLVSVWKPAYYRVARPYYIPIYGADGRIPFFFPPQPIFTNPGFPLDNPPSVRPSSGYLPPKVDATTGPPLDDMLGNRFGEEYPVWDSSPGRPTQTAPVAPTRRPRPPGASTTVPSLIHGEATQPPPSALQELEGRNDLIGQPTGQATPRPSQCVWAIVNCCSAGSKTVSNSCFERFACPGPFWDKSPCESDFARVAVQSALEYYGNK